jgi:hypothetical protein
MVAPQGHHREETYHQYRSTAPIDEWEGDGNVEMRMQELDELVSEEHQHHAISVDDLAGNHLRGRLWHSGVLDAIALSILPQPSRIY